MATRKIILSGKSYWARVYEGSHDEYSGKEFYKITVALDGDSWSKFSKSGMTLKARPVEKDSDIQGITFRRDLEGKEFVDKSSGKTKVLGGGTPRVVDENGDKMTALIGNGSEVEVLVEVYETKQKPPKIGHRLEAVKVTKLIPYDEFREDDVEEETVQVDTPKTDDSVPLQKTSKKDLPF